MNQVTDIEDIIFQLTLCLGRRQAEFLMNYQKSKEINTLGTLENIMTDRYGDNDLSAVKLMKFRRCAQQKNEKIEEYEDRVYQLFHTAYPLNNMSNREIDDIIKDQFISGLADIKLKKHLTLHGDLHMPDLKKKIKFFELSESRDDAVKTIERVQHRQDRYSENTRPGLYGNKYLQDLDYQGYWQEDQSQGKNQEQSPYFKEHLGNTWEKQTVENGKQRTDQEYTKNPMVRTVSIQDERMNKLEAGWKEIHETVTDNYKEIKRQLRKQSVTIEKQSALIEKQSAMIEKLLTLKDREESRSRRDRFAFSKEPYPAGDSSRHSSRGSSRVSSRNSSRGSSRGFIILGGSCVVTRDIYHGYLP